MRMGLYAYSRPAKPKKNSDITVHLDYASNFFWPFFLLLLLLLLLLLIVVIFLLRLLGQFRLLRVHIIIGSSCYKLRLAQLDLYLLTDMLSTTCLQAMNEVSRHGVL